MPYRINDKLLSHYAKYNMEFYYDHLGDGAATAESLYMSSSNLPVTVGVIIGTCVVLTVGVVVFIFILRYVKHPSSLQL